MLLLLGIFATWLNRAPAALDQRQTMTSARGALHPLEAAPKKPQGGGMVAKFLSAKHGGSAVQADAADLLSVERQGSINASVALQYTSAAGSHDRVEALSASVLSNRTVKAPHRQRPE